MPWAPWFGFSYIRPLWGYYAPFTFGRWDKYVPAGKYKPVSEYVYGNGLVSRSDYDENFAWSGRFTGTEYYTSDMLGSIMLTTDSLGHVTSLYFLIQYKVGQIKQLKKMEVLHYLQVNMKVYCMEIQRVIINQLV